MFDAASIPVNNASFTSYFLEGGTQLVRLLNIELKPPAYDATAYQLIFFLEGTPPEGDFVGAKIDQNNPALGNYAGQIGRVDFSPFDFKTKTITIKKTGEQRQINRDEDIASNLMGFAKQIGKYDELVNNKVGGVTIEEFVANVSRFLCTGNYYFWATLGQRDYINKEGKPTHSLFFPLPKNGKVAYAAIAAVGERPSNLLEYNKADHHTPVKEKTEQPVSGFGGQTGAPQQTGFGTQPAQTGFGQPQQAAPAWNQQPVQQMPQAPQQAPAYQQPAAQQVPATYQQPATMPAPNQPVYHQQPAAAQPVQGMPVQQYVGNPALGGNPAHATPFQQSSPQQMPSWQANQVPQGSFENAQNGQMGGFNQQPATEDLPF